MRAVTLLDAPPGADEVHGESGDDVVYGGGGNDRIFGDADNDDLDRRPRPRLDLRRHRQGRHPRRRGPDPHPRDRHVRAARTAYAALPRQRVREVGLALSADLGGDDVIFGGLGDDVLHGGAGDDAISGAEALAEGYAADRRRRRPSPRSSARTSCAPTTRAGCCTTACIAPARRCPTFALYDETRPNTKILVGGRAFFLNHDASSGPKLPVVPSDGDDRSPAAAGNDWLVGGTGRDNLSGGDGDDLLDADDDLDTGGGTNLFADPEPSYADVLTGGNGRDVFLTNGDQDVKVDPDGNFSGGTPNQGGNPLPVIGQPGPVSSNPRGTGRRREAEPAARQGQAQARPQEEEEGQEEPKKKAAKKKKAKKKKKKKKAKKKKRKGRR